MRNPKSLSFEKSRTTVALGSTAHCMWPVLFHTGIVLFRNSQRSWQIALGLAVLSFAGSVLLFVTFNTTIFQGGSNECQEWGCIEYQCTFLYRNCGHFELCFVGWIYPIPLAQSRSKPRIHLY
jgi:hypothetical protein